MNLPGREINSFDNPEEVADMLTGEELRASLAHNLEQGNLAAVAVLEQEIEWRRAREGGER